MWLTEKMNDALDWATATKTRGATVGAVAMVGAVAATGGLALVPLVLAAAGAASLGAAVSGTEAKKEEEAKK
jgi:mannitol-specific phosphotransferase system IIBC component